MRFWTLVATTFFLVSGGTYGTEEIVQSPGYALGLVILLITPLIWSLPTALMVGELSSALPHEGGFYAWVRRALGPFWGFQEAWLSLAASIFDMAIYPTLFVEYLSRLVPWFGEGYHGIFAGLAVIAVCTIWNLAGIHVVGWTSHWLFILLSGPFILIVILAPLHWGELAGVTSASNPSEISLLAGILICLWNYMGWDNASTIAREVEQPQRVYPKAMLATVALVTVSYVLPVLALWTTGLPAANMETGAWAEVAGLLGGDWLRGFLVIGGMLSAFGMFNSLVMSYSRLPYAMALDGMAPRVFARVNAKTRIPWVSVVVLAIAWSLCLGLGFERLITLDILLYGASLVLEFVALAVLRVREPNLTRPFRVPGGLVGAVAIGILPTALLTFSVIQSEREEVLGMNGLLFGVLIMLSGVLVYSIARFCRRRSEPAPELGVD
ncbi:MAG: APC family permease [Acidobacteria bacterium]|nr:APC family permease [Acidobacteriota bacterium]